MTVSLPVDWLCRAYCAFYKPTRRDEERCRAYTLAETLSGKWYSDAAAGIDSPFDPAFKRSFLREYVCERCSFLVDGCDFAAEDSLPNCNPCGGLYLLSGLLKDGLVTEEDIKQADFLEGIADRYLRLTPRCSIKLLEENYLYHIVQDELYQVNDDALAMLVRCDGSEQIKELRPDPGFLNICLDEDLLEVHESAHTLELRQVRSPVPSLRYLEWLVTLRCNLSCVHCYLGEPQSNEFPPELIDPLLEQFADMQGLRILISGGEPTIYKHFEVLNRALKNYPIRAVLLTNGINLDERRAARLNFHEVQISLDGIRDGHDLLRGTGTFGKTVEAMKAVRAVGLDLSVATMVHRGNIDQFDELRDFVSEMEAREWNIDYPCMKGRWEDCPGLVVEPGIAVEKMAMAFGGSYHGTSPGWTCGRHLAAVLPSGELCRCGLYADRRYGNIKDGLAEAWMRVRHIPIKDTECDGCPEAETCGGGCRFRAGGPRERDEVMCRLHRR